MKTNDSKSISLPIPTIKHHVYIMAQEPDIKITPEDEKIFGAWARNALPDIFQDWIKTYRFARQFATDTDYENLKIYFNRFLNFQTITIKAFNQLSIKRKADLRKVFTAAMLKIYKPEVFHYGNIDIDRGFNKQLSEVLGISAQAITKVVKDVPFWVEKNIDDIDNRSNDIIFYLDKDIKLKELDDAA